jgi:predicted Zn-dependent protease
MAIVQSTLAQQPENNLMNLLQGDIYKQMGRYDKAAEAYRLAQSREPQTPLPYIRMGDLFAQAKETKNAAAEYTRALNTSFIDPDNMFEIADRYVNIGYNNSASGVWNRLKTMNLNNLQLKKLEVKLGETLSVE